MAGQSVTDKGAKSRKERKGSSNAGGMVRAGKYTGDPMMQMLNQPLDLRYVGAWAPPPAGQPVTDPHAMGWDRPEFAYGHANTQHETGGPQQTVQAPPQMPQQQTPQQEQPNAVTTERRAHLARQALEEANLAAASQLQDGSGGYSLHRYLADEHRDPAGRLYGSG